MLKKKRPSFLICFTIACTVALFLPSKVLPDNCTSFTVGLEAAGPDPAGVTAIIGTYALLPSPAVRVLLQNCPVIVSSALGTDTAQSFVNDLRGAGATATAYCDEQFAPPERCSSYTVIIEDHGSSKLTVVRYVKDLTGLGLREAKSLVDSCCPVELASGLPEDEADFYERILESAGATVSIECDEQEEEAPEGAECSSYSVVMDDYGSAKLLIVSHVKELTGLGLREAKSLVDSCCPVEILAGLTLEEAERIESILEEDGASISIYCDEE